MKQANVFPLKKTLKKFNIWEINSNKGILKEDFQASIRVLIINKDSGGHTLAISSTKTRVDLRTGQSNKVTMSNHKSTESALKNHEVQVGQLAKQIADKSSNSFVANTKKNPKEECKAVMTRSKRFVEAEDEESVVHKKKAAEKKGTDGKKNDMASRKHKSIGSRPTTQYDTRGFHSLDAWNRYTDNVLGRNILLERKVELYHTELDDFKTELERRNFHKCLTNFVDGSIDLALVKEFYANLYNSEGPSPKQARVKGHLVKIDADSLNIFLETPMVLAEDDFYSPVKHTSRLGFPALIIALCRARGVVFGSLTFERLSPIINLAYIRKNCWNPEDLTVSIRGAKRARARPTELPSTSASPTPASTLAAPSIPTQTDSRRFEAMLQSIH
ncbi:hypothetical protein HKD37_04G010056 [Glycine soja]